MGIYTTVENALADYDSIRPDIVFSEVELPDTSGIEGIQLFRKKDADVKIIMLSKNKDFDMVKKGRHFDYTKISCLLQRPKNENFRFPLFLFYRQCIDCDDFFTEIKNIE